MTYFTLYYGRGTHYKHQIPDVEENLDEQGQLDLKKATVGETIGGRIESCNKMDRINGLLTT